MTIRWMNKEKRATRYHVALRLQITKTRMVPKSLAQASAEPLDAAAGFFQIAVFGGVRNAESVTETEGQARHNCNTLTLKKLGDEIFVIGELLARWRRLSHRTGAGWIDVERA